MDDCNEGAGLNGKQRSLVRRARKVKGRNPLDKCKLNKHMVLERTNKKCSAKVKSSSRGQSVIMVSGDAIK